MRNLLFIFIFLLECHSQASELVKAASIARADGEYLTLEQFHAFTKAIISAESNWKADAVSKAGAIGLMQIMPTTAPKYRKLCALPELPLEHPYHNVQVGTCILNEAIVKYNGNLVEVLIRYNAGGAWVPKYRRTGRIPDETRDYIHRVMHRYYKELNK
jgi:soluble lytic murein transglycosylase